MDLQDWDALRRNGVQESHRQSLDSHRLRCPNAQHRHRDATPEERKRLLDFEENLLAATALTDRV
ncbi:hypothetical protein IQ241_10215 [Romeria aff. gracilis LEGE 07310]|uniref:Uncharacterized protein n=1 Tax=Vasconcelosia minhoensis LEGE 07310 TaxID=915328 RepID=A0A8J7ACH1_9CYAN|nr:hypothetical protein [Romeria gracilis]MBE9077666.1 hypothetical protein [Romeria aff. gracilis LEGE 07310]